MISLSLISGLGLVWLSSSSAESSNLSVPSPLLRLGDLVGALSKSVLRPILFSRFESVLSAGMEEQSFESTTISDILKAKGKGADGSWLWCTTDDTVYDAVKSMTQHNVGALVVVKPGEQKSIAGIITERDYLRKIIVQGRSSKSTKVGDIMTEENKLITVTPDTKVLQAMQLMTDKRIRHIPVIDDKEMIGMVSIGMLSEL
ncbi:hypothetical protein GH714_011605 [Hevea brasiliensis]|uniref:CBS domain-containing protein n=1 Tax=Hevea brasiliensis TaxID=3981 RepID=A0A6A6KN03_HEVBR|nr:hypothetical protein GH714_011605 [Hevea brasiliensis]